MGRWLLVTVLLIVAVIAALGILMATDVIDGPALFWEYGPQISWLEPHLETYAAGKDSQGWINSQEEELRQQLADLQQRELELESGKMELEQRLEDLNRQEDSLGRQLAEYKRLQEQQRSVATLASLYTEMTAAVAAPILAQLEQHLILDVLLSMELQDAAEILSCLPAELAVTLSNLLGDSNK